MLPCPKKVLRNLKISKKAHRHENRCKILGKPRTMPKKFPNFLNIKKSQLKNHPRKNLKNLMKSAKKISNSNFSKMSTIRKNFINLNLSGKK